jgi:hypothetical protein
VGPMAHEEAIQAEAQKADHFLALEARGLNGPPGYGQAIASTLGWVWRGSGRPPLDIHQPTPADSFFMKDLAEQEGLEPKSSGFGDRCSSG